MKPEFTVGQPWADGSEARETPDRYRKGKVCRWLKIELFCQHCGARDMWQDPLEGGDYYHDCSATCFACGGEACCVGPVQAPRAKKAEVE